MKTENELRCFCGRAPLLAIFGLDEEGKVYVHVRIYKQKRVFGEILVTGGVVKLKCRDCGRWHRVLIRPARSAELVLDNQPPNIVAAT